MNGSESGRPADAACDEAACQDFAAALHEIESNVDVRRLMVVVIHVLVPGMAMVLVNTTTGASYPAQLAWLPHHVLWIVGIVLAIGGLVTSVILARCHFGMVVNGAKMQKVDRGEFRPTGLNWLGVTTNFLAINGLTAAAGTALVGLAFGAPFLGAVAGIVLFALMLVILRVQHTRANALCGRLAPSWQRGGIPLSLREEHLRKSLDATAADVAVVVTMAAALFTGTFDAMANVGALSREVLPGVAVGMLQTGAMTALSCFSLVSLLLSARIVVRLRIAVAEHSERLASLRGEQDEPWRFRLTERTFLLFVLVMLLASAMALVAGWTIGGAWGGGDTGPLVGGVLAAALALAGLVWYPLQLRFARPRA
jgi:hypothetical protein